MTIYTYIYMIYVYIYTCICIVTSILMIYIYIYIQIYTLKHILSYTWLLCKDGSYHGDPGKSSPGVPHVVGGGDSSRRNIGVQVYCNLPQGHLGIYLCIIYTHMNMFTSPCVYIYIYTYIYMYTYVTMCCYICQLVDEFFQGFFETAATFSGFCRDTGVTQLVPGQAWWQESSSDWDTSCSSCKFLVGT